MRIAPFSTVLVLCATVWTAPAADVMPTPVAGFIATNTTWTLAGSPYILTGSLSVGFGATLTIDAGVVVQLSGFQMSAGGVLGAGAIVANGTAALPITFTGPGGLNFPGSAISAVFGPSGAYVSGSKLDYCIVQGCASATGCSIAAGAIGIVSSSPYIKDCDVRGATNCLTACSSNGLRIDGGFFDGGLGTGIFLLNCANCVISGASMSRNLNGGVSTSNCVNTTVNDCRIIGNSNSGVNFGGTAPGLISNCEIAANSTVYGGAGISLVGGGPFVIAGCDIVGNVAVVGNGGGVLSVGSSAVVSDCRIIRNFAGTGGGLYLNGPTTLTGTPSSFNTIIGNANFDVYNAQAFPSASSLVDATNVCWGVQPSATAGRLFGFAQSPGLGIILDSSPVACGPWHSFGTGVSGSAGVPILGATGSPSGSFTLTLSNGLPNATVLIGASFAPAYTHFGGLDVFLVPGLGPSTFILPSTTDGLGNWTATLASPVPIPSGVLLVVQAAIIDTGAPNGLVSLTRPVIGEF